MSLLIPILNGAAQTPVDTVYHSPNGLPITRFSVPETQPVAAVLPPASARLLALKTNLLHDFLVVPRYGFAPGINLQLEYYPQKGHYSGNVGFTFSHNQRKKDFKFFQARELQLELRRYFKGNAAFVGPYVGVFGQGILYGLALDKTQGWIGEGGGGGLSAGWVWALDKKGHLKLEVSLSLGVLYSRYDPFVYGNPITETEDGLYYYDYMGKAQDFQRRNHQFFWFGPTNAGIQISYALFGRKKRP